MKNECPHCGYENLLDSNYCQECGENIEDTSKGANTISRGNINKSISSQINEIDDIIFQPKKKRSSAWGVIVLLGLVLFLILFFFVLIFYESEEDASTPIYETDYSNTQTYNSEDFPIYYLDIEEIDSEWVGSQFYLKGVLKNTYSEGAKNVKLRVDFYGDENQTRQIDTRFVTIQGVSAKGAYSFKVPVYINSPEGNFWYVAEIQEAEYIQ